MPLKPSSERGHLMMMPAEKTVQWTLSEHYGKDDVQRCNKQLVERISTGRNLLQAETSRLHNVAGTN